MIKQISILNKKSILKESIVQRLAKNNIQKR